MRHALPTPTAAVLAAVLTAAVLPLTGCFVLDELDAGAEIMDAHSPKRNKKAKEAATASSEKGEEEKPAGQAWWSQARSLNRPAEDAASDDPAAVVSCRLGGATRFMRRGDCLSQGGRPAAR